MCLSAIFRNFEGNWPGLAVVMECPGSGSAGHVRTVWRQTGPGMAPSPQWPQASCPLSLGSVKEKTCSRRSVLRTVFSQFPVALLNDDLNSQSPSIGKR